MLTSRTSNVVIQVCSVQEHGCLWRFFDRKLSMAHLKGSEWWAMLSSGYAAITLPTLSMTSSVPPDDPYCRHSQSAELHASRSSYLASIHNSSHSRRPALLNCYALPVCRLRNKHAGHAMAPDRHPCPKVRRECATIVVVAVIALQQRFGSSGYQGLHNT